MFRFPQLPVVTRLGPTCTGRFVKAVQITTQIRDEAAIQMILHSLPHEITALLLTRRKCFAISGDNVNPGRMGTDKKQILITRVKR